MGSKNRSLGRPLISYSKLIQGRSNYKATSHTNNYRFLRFYEFATFKGLRTKNIVITNKCFIPVILSNIYIFYEL